jgi:protoporphyrinogen/coproporphyrinogen III oxidase
MMTRLQTPATAAGSVAADIPGESSCDVAVVGGGISGLAAALYLTRGGARVTLLEGADRPGGVLRTLQDGDWTFELGPNTVLEKPPVAELLAAAGLTDERVAAAPAGKRRYIWKGDRLEPMPGGPLGLVRTPLFPAGAKLALLREPFVGRGPATRAGGADGDESVADFVRRRLGPAWLRYAVGPFVSGVYAGDPERLSVRWAVPRIAALERDHGSLIRGAVAKMKGPAPGGAMIGYTGGFEALARRLAEQLPDVRLGTPVTALERRPDGFRLVTPAGVVSATRVVLALPADTTAELLAGPTGGRSLPLGEVPYAPVVVGCLGYRREQIAHPLDGFGFLAPRDEGLRVLGGLFSSALFAGRAPAGHAALTVFAGGAMDRELVTLDDEAVWQVLARDLGRALGITGAPVFRQLRRWPRAIPQYELGHGRFVALAADLEGAMPGLYLAGNWLGGVSVSDSIARGADVAARALVAWAAAAV